MLGLSSVLLLTFMLVSVMLTHFYLKIFVKIENGKGNIVLREMLFFFCFSFIFSCIALYYINKLSNAKNAAVTSTPVPTKSGRGKKNVVH